ncbi:Aste57867_8093 [Aphanomyces stellatus]|uniref:Aste57867_8093 protein n=1 Tax=Aphanomyces stellatus TaxID=120398 RepID=A0A485KJB7_9STRA|nr:hypothetical protein As57867_008063 [Aphanomyces stellatus]VFT84982.1 Aste57867_8093 [Aphanomyces stellatus]
MPIFVVVFAVIFLALYVLKQRNDHLQVVQFTQPDLVFHVQKSKVPPFQNRRTVLVTGGNGFLGSHAVSLLMDKYNVIVMDLVVPRRCHPSVTYVQGNLLNMDHILAALEVLGHDIQVDAVLHLASLLPALDVPEGAMTRINVDGTQHLLHACQDKNVTAFIYTSDATIALGREPMHVRQVNEDMSFSTDESLDTYTQTKTIAERLVLASHCADPAQPTTTAVKVPLATCALRPTSMMVRVDKDARVRGKYTLDSNGTTLVLRDYVSVVDVAQAHVLAMEALLTPQGRARIGGQAYFIGSDSETPRRHSDAQPSSSVRVLYWLAFLNHAVFELTGQILLHKHVTAANVDASQRTYTFSSAKAKRDLGYAPTAMGWFEAAISRPRQEDAAMS